MVDLHLFVWLISHQPTVLFSQNKPATGNQAAVLFSQNKSAPATSQTNRLLIPQDAEARDHYRKLVVWIYKGKYIF
jgi:hypothetical protein